MGERFEIDPRLPDAECAALTHLAERLEHERPLPSQPFHAALRGRSMTPYIVML